MLLLTTVSARDSQTVTSPYKCRVTFHLLYGGISYQNVHLFWFPLIQGYCQAVRQRNLTPPRGVTLSLAGSNPAIPATPFSGNCIWSAVSTIYGSLAQRQSIRLITGRLLVRVQQEPPISRCSAVGSAPVLGAGCRRFKSCHLDHGV